MGSKTLSLPDNRLKSFISNKSNRVKFMDETYKIKRSNVQFTKIVKILFPCSMHKYPYKIQGIQIVIVFTFLLIISQTKRF
jgi:hypothetical protein